MSYYTDIYLFIYLFDLGSVAVLLHFSLHNSYDVVAYEELSAIPEEMKSLLRPVRLANGCNIDEGIVPEVCNHSRSSRTLLGVGSPGSSAHLILLAQKAG